MSAPTSPVAAPGATSSSILQGVGAITLASASATESLDTDMEDAPPKLDSSNPDSIKETLKYLHSKAARLTDAVFNASFASGTDESIEDESARLQHDLDFCEKHIKNLQRRLENLGSHNPSPTVANTSSDVTKSSQIPITEFLSFDPDFWKSYHLDPNVINSIKPNQSNTAKPK